MHCNKLTCDTRRYLSEFENILKNMICLMNGASLNDSISHNFIVQMLPHHRAAIDMSRSILEYTDDSELKNIALSIISEQTQSIANMREVLCRCNEIKNSACDLQSYQSKINSIKQTMFSGMRSACADNNISCNFMREMIPHHMGAVKMSKTTLKFEICPQLKPILDAIIISQEKGIEQMEHLLQKLGCAN